MSQHSHLTFLSHGESRLGASNTSVEISIVDNRTPQEKLIDVVEYLQQLKTNKQVTTMDIINSCRVDVEGKDYEVLDHMKRNPKIIVLDDNGTLRFQYRAKFELRNKHELLRLIQREHGLCLKDIADCYEDIKIDVSDAIRTGDIIGVINKETRDTVLFSRGMPFLTQLSGNVTGTSNSKYLRTQSNLQNEIRRGDAVRVESNWFRVSSTVGSKKNDPKRARAPLSVTSAQDLSDRNEYVDIFDEKTLPLDSELELDDNVDTFSGCCFKHGCTNDVRDLWNGTWEQVKRFHGKEKELQQELLKLNLISCIDSNSLSVKRRTTETDEEKKANKKRMRKRELKITNTHLKGTVIGNILATAVRNAMS